MESILEIEPIIIKYIGSRPKQDGLKHLFEELFEKKFLDEVTSCLSFEVIMAVTTIFFTVIINYEGT